MSLLTLVRHGQASFFAERYDQLSPLGEQQSRLLGEYWARHGVQLDEVYTGPRQRQLRSAELAGEAYRQTLAELNSKAAPWPEPIVLDDLDEYDLRGLLHRLSPGLAEQNAKFAELAEAHRQSEAERDRLRTFQAMFEMLLTHWQETGRCDADVESWPDFRRRVERVLRRVQDQPGKSRRVALFTSGGFIGTATQWALAAPDKSALELNWRVRNSSLTDFAFTADRITLDSFNTLPHLADPKLWTYR